jgi:tetratricopeptide (TPR) repeat protein
LGDPLPLIHSSENSVIVPSALALEAETLRFRLSHHLGGSPKRLKELLAALEFKVPHHPVVRNQHAWLALPETALPAPPPELAAAASAWLAGDVNLALAKAREASRIQEHPRTTTTIADLYWSLGQRRDAVELWQEVRDKTGPLPPLLTRLGRAALVAGRTEDALEGAVQALSANPLYGTAFVLLSHTHRAQGHEILPVPLPNQIRHIDGQLRMVQELGARAETAWLKALEAARNAPPQESPPGRTAASTLTKTWLALAPDTGRRDAPAEWPLRALCRWQKAGLLDTYLWAVGLTPLTADLFRTRTIPLSQDRQFWSQAVLRPRRTSWLQRRLRTRPNS